MEPCRICGNTLTTPFLTGQALAAVPEDLRITDARYGLSAPLVKCRDCGFIWADPPPATDLAALYARLEDPDYVDGHDYRLRQMEQLLERTLAVTPKAHTLLDVGAASGLLVAAARSRGLEATGVEPSASLVRAAASRGITLHEGILPHAALQGRTFDLVTAVDVIEHVTDPIALLRAMRAHLAPGGHLVITTPDVDSLARRVLGSRWWHFRLAHVCFLPLATLDRAFAAANLRRLHHERQRWLFSIAYLGERATRLVGGARAVPLAARLGRSRRLGQMHVPLDLRDSWVVIAAGGP